jgi:hypothetical protein
MKFGPDGLDLDADRVKGVNSRGAYLGLQIVNGRFRQLMVMPDALLALGARQDKAALHTLRVDFCNRDAYFCGFSVTSRKIEAPSSAPCEGIPGR